MFPMNPMFQMMQQVMQIKRNPNQLANLLRQKGMIDDNQFAEVSKMGGNYEQIGQYLMQNGRLPSNIQPYEQQVNQMQNAMNQQFRG